MMIFALYANVHVGNNIRLILSPGWLIHHLQQIIAVLKRT